MTLSPDRPPPSPAEQVPQWVADEAARLLGAKVASGPGPLRPEDVAPGHLGGHLPPGGPPPAPPPGPDDVPTGPVFEPVPDTRLPGGDGLGRSAKGVVALVVVGVLAAALSTVQDTRRPDPLGPTAAGVVLRTDPADLPAPLTTSRHRPTAGFEEGPAPLGTPPTLAETSPSYAFQFTQQDPTGTEVPVTWSPCRPIHVVIDPTGAPEGFEDQVLAGLGAVSVASGLVFAYDGITDEAPTTDRPPFQPTRYGDRWVPVMIRFADERTSPKLAGTVAGLAWSQRALDPWTGVWQYVTGTVHLDSTLLAWPDRQGVPAYVPALRHELGHLVGLAHVDDSAQLLHGSPSHALTFQLGDLTGLAALGAGPCARGV